MSCLCSASSGAGGGTPDSVAQDFISCLKSADIEGIQKYSTGELTKGLGMIDGENKEAITDCFKHEFANKKFEIGQAEINGDKAKVSVKINGRNKSITLVKVDGDWKVADFDFIN